jgi:hypothetical protein
MINPVGSPAYAPRVLWRGALAIVAAVSVACGGVAAIAEPSPTELLQKASTNLKNAKTAHIDGNGSFGITSGLTLSFDFKLNGDAELPDKARLTTQMNMFGQSFSVDTITIGGKTYSKGLNGDSWSEAAAADPQGAVLDPLGQADLSNVVSVSEVDRPDVDGRKTRHLSYAIDQAKLLDKMRGASGNAAGFSVANANGKGEVWVRTEDSQIVRQLVKLTFDIEGDLGIPGASPGASKGTFDITFDLKFSHIGEPITPAISAPPH